MIYTHDNGLLLFDGDIIRVFSEATMLASISDPDKILAKCGCFNLMGQGKGITEAVVSLRSVLTNHLDYYHRENMLAAVLTSEGWTKLQTKETLTASFVLLDLLFARGIVVSTVLTPR